MFDFLGEIRNFLEPSGVLIPPGDLALVQFMFKCGSDFRSASASDVNFHASSSHSGVRV